MRNNLINALRSEAILLVVDNFEKKLENIPGDHSYVCGDSQWDRLLQALAKDLQGMQSRLLVISRHLPAVFFNAKNELWIPWGLYPQERPGSNSKMKEEDFDLVAIRATHEALLQEHEKTADPKTMAAWERLMGILKK